MFINMDGCIMFGNVGVGSVRNQMIPLRASKEKGQIVRVLVGSLVV